MVQKFIDVKMKLMLDIVCMVLLLGLAYFLINKLGGIKVNLTYIC